MRSLVKFVGLLAVAAGAGRGILACLYWIDDPADATFRSGLLILVGLLVGLIMIIREEIRRDSLQGMKLFTRRD
jgi:hypothetical protein